jgi:hypothetical protein
MRHEICPKCGKSTIERYPQETSLAVCLNRDCFYKEKVTDKPHCKVCSSEIIEDFTDEVINPLDGNFKVVKVPNGFYCKLCGIKYQFIKTDELRGKSK